MNFNIYLDDKTGQELANAAERSGESRNALIREAVREWLGRYGQAQWPDAVRNFEGMSDMPAFEAGRDALQAPLNDPLR